MAATSERPLAAVAALPETILLSMVRTEAALPLPIAMPPPPAPAVVLVAFAVLPVIVLFWTRAVPEKERRTMPPPEPAAVLPAMVLLRTVNPPAATVPKK